MVDFVLKYAVAILFAMLALTTVFGVHECGAAQKAQKTVKEKVAEEKLKENPQLADAGVKVDTAVPRDVLEQKLQDAEVRNADFARQLKEAREAAGPLTPTSVTHAEGNEVPVGGVPIEGGGATAQPATVRPPAEAAPGTPVKPADVPACVLTLGSMAKFELDEAQLINNQGVSLHLLSISAYRTWPAPVTKLFTDRMVVPLSATYVRQLEEAAVAKAARKLFLTFSADWDPANLHARPEWTLELDYTALTLGRLDLGAYVALGRWYTVGANQDWNVRGGLKLDAALW